jgi:2-aminoethylphosphonate-pyruvate transaminase
VLDKLQNDGESNLKANIVTHVAMIHSETTSGLINPIQEVGQLIKHHNKSVFIIFIKIVFIVDAMSSFGAYKILTSEWGN